MYRRLIKAAKFYHNKPVTKHGGGKIERRARIAMYIASKEVNINVRDKREYIGKLTIMNKE